MKKLVCLAVVMMLAVTAIPVLAGNAHKDGNGAVMNDEFTPGKTTSLSHTKADVRYTPGAGVKKVRITPTAAVFYQLSSSQNKKDTVGFPIAANGTDKIGIATRGGVGVDVKKIIFSGASTATKTIYIQEQ